jgi:heme exporter protein C
MIWKLLILAAMALVIVLAFVLPSPMDPAISLGPVDAYRIFYFHVPAAWVAALSFVVGMIQSALFLKTKNMDYDRRAVTANRLGMVFSAVALITGSIFAKMTWGEFWNWSEIREVSIFILLLIYGGYFALRSALADADVRATFSAVMTIIFTVAALFLIFVLPRIYPAFSQHPSDTIIDNEGKMSLSPMVALVFGVSMATFTALYFWLYNITVRSDRYFDKFRSEK